MKKHSGTKIASDLTTVIKALLGTADVRSQGFFAALAALNSLDWCELNQQQVGTTLDGLDTLSTGLHQRYSNYIPPMITRILQISQ